MVMWRSVGDKVSAYRGETSRKLTQRNQTPIRYPSPRIHLKNILTPYMKHEIMRTWMFVVLLAFCGIWGSSARYAAGPKCAYRRVRYSYDLLRIWWLTLFHFRFRGMDQAARAVLRAPRDAAARPATLSPRGSRSRARSRPGPLSELHFSRGL